jgi:hypothetical protein
MVSHLQLLNFYKLVGKLGAKSVWAKMINHCLFAFQPLGWPLHFAFVPSQMFIYEAQKYWNLTSKIQF